MYKTTAITSALLGMLSLAGCSTTSRYVTAEHWPQRDHFFVAYTEYTSTNYLVTRSGESNAHVMLCHAGETNEVTCRPQPAVDRLLNPHASYPDEPPPAAAAPVVAKADEPADEPAEDEPEAQVTED